MDGHKRWWEPVPVAQDGVILWRLGPFDLCVWRRAQEWRLAWARSTDPLRDACGHESGVWAPEAYQGSVRVVTGTTGSTLALRPASADRDLVVRPDPAVHLPPGCSASLYVSAPLWVHVLDGTALLADLPSVLPSDTWFGTSTREGELCYASRTSARLTLSELPRRPARSTTRVDLHNHGEDALVVDRIKVPVRHLALHVDDKGGLWTPTLDMTRGRSEARSSVEIGKPPIGPDGPWPQLAPPREEGVPSMLFRAFDALLS